MKKQTRLSETIFLDKRTGQQTRSYTFGGVKCPKVELKTKKAGQHAGYTLIELDLEDAGTWLDEAYKLMGPREEIPENSERIPYHYFHSDKDRNSRLIKSFWFSAIIIYGKCFAQADGRKIKLEESNLPQELRDYHRKIINFRNSIVAHAGEGDHESATVELVLSPQMANGRMWIRNNARRLEFADDRNEPINFEHLIKRAREYVTDKRKSLSEQLKNEVLKEPIKAWYGRAAFK